LDCLRLALAIAFGIDKSVVFRPTAASASRWFCDYRTTLNIIL
jgi:hypothetical protein